MATKKTKAAAQARAIRFHETGGPDVLKLEDVPVPPPGKDEVTIAQEAIGVNFIDIYYRTGLYPAPMPSGLGFEGAGVVEAVGPGVAHVKVGDRVAYGQGPLGAYATRRTMPALQVVRLPDADLVRGRCRDDAQGPHGAVPVPADLSAAGRRDDPAAMRPPAASG